jgi:hypothetical protein
VVPYKKVKIKIKTFKVKFFFWGRGLRPRNAPMLKPITVVYYPKTIRPYEC